MKWIVPLSLLIGFEVIADIFSKEYSLKGHWYLWAGAILGYIVANVFWLMAIKNGAELARGAIIFSVATAIVAIIIGVHFYNEDVNKIQLAGMALGVVSIALILWE